MNWQNWVAILVVLVAAAWLLRRMWRIFQAAFGNGELPDCGNCAKNPSVPKEETLIQINRRSKP